MPTFPSTRLMRLLPLLLLAALLAWPNGHSALGAEPGEELLSSSGTLNAGQSITIVLYAADAANLRLSVTGGDAADQLNLRLLNSTGNTLRSWVARSGETLWGSADLPSGGRLQIENPTANALSYALLGYARGTVATPHSGAQSIGGTAIGAGSESSNSAVELVAPNAGLYRLTLSAGQGSFQLVVDEGYLRKTVVSGQGPAADDTVYYLSAGVHRFEIIQDPSAAAITEWSLAMTAAGSLDSLPFAEAAPALGGALGAGSFTDEQIPLQVATAQSVNLRIQVDGAAGDALQVVLLNGATSVYTATAVRGGEIVWGSANLAAGANSLRIVSQSGNSGPLAYQISVDSLPTPELNWSGISQGSSSLNSAIKLRIPSDGLYRFSLGAASGRYQFRINNTALRKIVSDETSFSAFLPAGTHSLLIDQDRSVDTSWSVGVSADTASADSLPFTMSGATLGGAGKDFREEWQPIRMDAAGAVNLRISARGASAGDSLRVEIVAPGASSSSYTANAIFKDEVFWATTDLLTGTNLIKVTAAEGNATALEYDLEVRPVAAVPTAWSGTALGAGLNARVTINAPSDGIYTLTMTTTTGAAIVLIDNPTEPSGALLSAVPTSAGTLTLRVPLDAGPHTVTLQQDSALARTDWQIALRQIRDATPLSIQRVTPGYLLPGAGGELSVIGDGFESATIAELIDADGQVTPISSAAVSVGELTLTVPADLPAGVYSLRLRNPGGEQSTATNAVSIGQVRVFLPLIVR